MPLLFLQCSWKWGTICVGSVPFIDKFPSLLDNVVLGIHSSNWTIKLISISLSWWTFNLINLLASRFSKSTSFPFISFAFQEESEEISTPKGEKNITENHSEVTSKWLMLNMPNLNDLDCKYSQTNHNKVLFNYVMPQDLL